MPKSPLADVMRAVDKHVYAAIQAGVSSMTGAAVEIAEYGRDEAKRLVDHPGSYKPYYDDDGNLRMSSKPGEPPASGPEYKLYNSIFSRQITPKNSNPARAAFGTYAPYAQSLEYGDSSKAPRPFMRVARKTTESVAHLIVKKHWNRAVKRKIAKMRPTTSPPIIIG